MNALVGYRTLIAALLIAAVGGLSAHFGWGLSQDDRTAVAFEGAGAIMIVLRHITTGPASWRKQAGSILSDPEVQALIAEIEARFEPKLVAAHPGIQGIDLGGYTQGLSVPIAPPVPPVG